MEDVNANDKPDWQKEIKSNIGMNLAGLYLEGGDMEKTISSHRWWLEHCSRRDVLVMRYVIRLSRNFNRYEKFEYTLEVLEGSMDMMKILGNVIPRQKVFHPHSYCFHRIASYLCSALLFQW